MNGDVLIEATAISKTFPVQEGVLRTMAGLLAGSGRQQGFSALDAVSVSLARGDALGIVGRNGAGKSTLLQIICGTQAPTRGSVKISGRIAAMLQLGAGFNPEFTGRENVYLNASIYGLNKRQINERFSRIAAFADIGDAIDRPVAEYSSGMFARLAFAVCAHVDADVLIVDEVLSVGDVLFQAKCIGFIETFLKRGAVIFVSHDEQAILSVCNRAIWLDQGRWMAEGLPEAILRLYRNHMLGEDVAVEDAGEVTQPGRSPPISSFPPLSMDPRYGKNPILISQFRSNAPSHGHGGAVIEDVYFSDTEGQRLELFQGGQTVALHIKGNALGAISRPFVGFILRDALGQNLFGDNTFTEYRDRLRTMWSGDAYHATLQFQMPFLPVGLYTIAPAITDGTQQNHIQLHWIEEALVLTVQQSPVEIGKIGVPMSVASRLRSEA
jgi:lipopolysaccharide transport system ATP-binding protein